MPAEQIVRLHVVAPEQAGRQQNASPARIESDPPEDTRHPPDDAGLGHLGDQTGIGMGGRHSRQQPVKRPGGAIGVGFQTRLVRNRLFGQVGAPAIDQSLDQAFRQPGPADQFGQRVEHLVAGGPDVVGIGRGYRVPPPLEPHLAEERLAHHLAGSGDFQIEGKNGAIILPRRAGGEQRGQKPVPVVPADLLGAVAETCGHLPLNKGVSLACPPDNGI